MRAACLLVILVATPAFADPCKSDAPWPRKAATLLQQASDDAELAALTCGFHGPDDKALDKLAAEVKQAFQDPPAGLGTCKLTPAGGTTTSVATRLASWSGERIGYAVRMCSSKVIARIAELKKQGTSEAEIEKQVGELASAWFRAAVKP